MTVKFTNPGALTAPIDETTEFAPKFDAAGLIPAVAVDGVNGGLLMVAWMNAEALALTIETGEAHYWSRSRQALWRKGATSGHRQKVLEIRTDCDQDVIELRVDQTGGACHTHRRSCFYRVVEQDGATLSFKE